MKIIICGAGRVGSTIAKYLTETEHEVVVVDNDVEKLNQLESELDIQTVEGFSSYPSILEKANAMQADMLIAVTASDEVNLVTCQAANSLFKVPIKIARLRSREYTNSKWKNLYSHDALPIDVVISPEYEIAQSIRKNISFPGAFEVLTLVGDKVYLLGIHCDELCPLLNVPLRQLTELFPNIGAIVSGVVRENKLIVPDSQFRLEAGDDAYIFVPVENVNRLLALFEKDQQKFKNILILGGNDIGLSLARYLEHSGKIRVGLIEKDEDRATYLAENLSKTTVINGDFLDSDVLEEADIGVVESVIAVTDVDENNILASLMAKKYGVDQTISVIEKTLYAQMVSELGVDVIVDPKDIMVSSILRHIRRGKIRNAFSIRSGLCEIMEAVVFDEFEFINTALRDVRFPSGILIGAIVRKGNPIKLSGDTIIEKNDILVLFVASEEVKYIEKMFLAVRNEGK